MKAPQVRYAGVTIIAIGGGGFTHESDPRLEDFILAQCRIANPKIGYVGAANIDRSDRIQHFHRRFNGRGSTSHLVPGTAPRDAADWVECQDIIYLAGGDTGRLLQFLRATHLDAAMLQAAQNGTILAGVSAGAVCWFEFALSDAGGNGLAPLPGLGLIGGSCCPHYSSEPERRPAFRRAIANGSMPAGLAIDDGVAVLLQHDRPPQAFAARSKAGAYLISGESEAGIALPLLKLD
jgi:peptidase E